MRPPFLNSTRSTFISASHWRQPPHGEAVIAATTKSPGAYPSTMARENVVPRIFARTHQSRRTPWVAIVFTTIIALVLIVGVGETGVNTLASATVAFLLAVFALVCLCALVLRRDSVPQDHYTAPTAILFLGVVVNVALLLYVLITDLQGLLAGDTGLRESVVVVCLVMLLIGGGLYFVNNFALRRLDPERTDAGRDGRE